MKSSRQHFSLALLGLISLSLAPTLFSGGTSRKPSSIISPSDDSALKASYRRPEIIPYPKKNPYSEEKYNLGKKLFFDPRLSQSNVMSCATCHNPSFSWGDGLPKSVGHGHKVLNRRAPTILNSAWGASFFWDGRVRTLEEQALKPIESPDEMNLKIPELVKKLEAVPQYREAFEKAFPGEKISGATIGKAIATFERGVVSDLAPFDYWIEGSERAISESAKRGFQVFNDKGKCVICHNGWNFTNGSFADTGLSKNDIGRGKIDKNKYVQFAFKTPTLRNVAVRAPYMHDGSIPTLREVVETYNKAGKIHRMTSKLFLQPLHLSEQEKEDLVAFLETLTAKGEAVEIPALPVSVLKGEK
jgi:cytochrome c peroxidase